MLDFFAVVGYNNSCQQRGLPLKTGKSSEKAAKSQDNAELCNGSTTDSDSVCLGSNPSSAAIGKTL